MKIRAAITAVHGYVPDYVLSNQVLETMVDTNSEWIETRTGIKERRILKGKGLATSDMAVEAIKGLLKKKNIAPEEIDMIIVATATPEFHFPSNACVLQHELGVREDIPAFDLNAACAGFVYALSVADQFMKNDALCDS